MSLKYYGSVHWWREMLKMFQFITGLTHGERQLFTPNLELPIYLTCILFDCWKKLGHLEENHTGTERTCKLTQKGSICLVWPKNLLVVRHKANHCTTIIFFCVNKLMLTISYELKKFANFVKWSRPDCDALAVCECNVSLSHDSLFHIILPAECCYLALHMLRLKFLSSVPSYSASSQTTNWPEMQHCTMGHRDGPVNWQEKNTVFLDTMLLHLQRKFLVCLNRMYIILIF